MQAYDADGDIDKVMVLINRRNGSSYTRSVPFQHSRGKLYTGTLACSNFTGYEGEYYISQIRLVDKRDNYVDYPIMEDGEYRYTFSFAYKKNGTATVSNFQMQKNASNADGKLRVGDTVTYTAQGWNLKIMGICFCIRQRMDPGFQNL